jgi:hypothetical protein
MGEGGAHGLEARATRGAAPYPLLPQIFHHAKGMGKPGVWRYL